jgi:hypothetical protein
MIMPLIATTPLERMDRPYPRRWAALAVLCLSLLVIVMANTSLLVAAPGMTKDLDLGGSLGIAILGSILASSYTSGIAFSVGGRLPAQATATAKESIGGALAVAQEVAATAGPRQAGALVHAADHAFTHAVAHTSLVGGVILAVGTVLVTLLLPGTRRAASADEPAAPRPAPLKASAPR